MKTQFTCCFANIHIANIIVIKQPHTHTHTQINRAENNTIIMAGMSVEGFLLVVDKNKTLKSFFI